MFREICEIFFFWKYPGFWNMKLVFFSFRIYPVFFFPNREILILPKLHFCKFEKKSEKLFWEGGRSLIISRFAASFALASSGLSGEGSRR